VREEFRSVEWVFTGTGICIVTVIVLNVVYKIGRWVVIHLSNNPKENIVNFDSSGTLSDLDRQKLFPRKDSK
jgi:hypothetical protein